MDYYVYVVRCADGSLYTGIATEIERRVREHNGEAPGGARYTSGRRPVKLAYREKCATRSEALKREHRIKQMSKKEKDLLIKENGRSL
jgi:putative endonuclease